MASDLLLEATDANFNAEVVSGNLPTVVDFWAPHCGPCRQIAPILEDLATQYEGQVRVAKVNTDHNPGVARAMGIMSIPTLIAFRDGEVVGKMVGFRNRRGIEEFFERTRG